MSECALIAKPLEPATYVLARDAARVTWFLKDNLVPAWTLNPDTATRFESCDDALEYRSLVMRGNNNQEQGDNAICRRLKESYVAKHRPLQTNDRPIY